MELFENGITIRGEEKIAADTPAAAVCRVVRDAFMSHPKLRSHVDLYLVMLDPQTVELTYLATDRGRRKGYAGVVLDLLTKAADKFDVTLKLQAHFAKEDKRKKDILDQDGLEGFYSRRGFQITDPNVRFMQRHPQI